ncbi:lichenicidin A2 family type 2 lantibiotic [Rossellomorea aquimaris]|uniref:Type 2 lantibiotic (TIGR03893 family)/mersacidin/lichenicidin family type 2 lantibiotic n=1 Tax=Rossellomorea aquimaris TaxID=189382 RepID=A0A366EJ97_9BACI|nr:mersacidin family lantibiotic [Rossellomorea aquimaris]RBP02481.1 type 2 lantibiotic (TIGR03893 family)/mersacidin/lichenicidin family type 2 lantibiotic [Rossellomorea aquimaris]
MTKEMMIQAWKNPELRSDLTNHPAGQAFSELSADEMRSIQGAGDVQPETTPSLSSGYCLGWATVGISITISYATC